MEEWLQLWIMFSIPLILMGVGAFKLDAKAREEYERLGTQKKSDDYV